MIESNFDLFLQIVFSLDFYLLFIYVWIKRCAISCSAQIYMLYRAKSRASVLRYYKAIASLNRNQSIRIETEFSLDEICCCI